MFAGARPAPGSWIAGFDIWYREKEPSCASSSIDSPPEPYTADAAVLCCFDQRIRLATNKFLQRQRILQPDMIVVAGGAKTLASARHDFERDFILEQMGMSIRAAPYGTGLSPESLRFATYGGLGAFGDDRQREMEHPQHELQRAAELVHVNFPDLTVENFFHHF